MEFDVSLFPAVVTDDILAYTLFVVEFCGWPGSSFVSPKALFKLMSIPVTKSAPRKVST
jgi:hypothetical protein